MPVPTDRPMSEPRHGACSSSSASAGSSATSPCSRRWRRRRNRPAAMGRLATGARAAGVQVVHLTYLPLAGGRSASQRSPLMRATTSTAAWSDVRPGARGRARDRRRARRPGAAAAPGHLAGAPHRGADHPAQHGHGRGRRGRRVDQPGHPARRRRRGRRGLRRHGRDGRLRSARRPSTTRPCSGTASPSWPASPRRTSCWPSGQPDGSRTLRPDAESAAARRWPWSRGTARGPRCRTGARSRCPCSRRRASRRRTRGRR